MNLLVSATLYGEKVNYELQLPPASTTTELVAALDTALGAAHESRRRAINSGAPDIPRPPDAMLPLPKTPFRSHRVRAWDSASNAWVELIDYMQKFNVTAGSMVLPDWTQLYVFQQEGRYHTEVQGAIPRPANLPAAVTSPEAIEAVRVKSLSPVRLQALPPPESERVNESVRLPPSPPRGASRSISPVVSRSPSHPKEVVMQIPDLPRPSVNIPLPSPGRCLPRSLPERQPSNIQRHRASQVIEGSRKVLSAGVPEEDNMINVLLVDIVSCVEGVVAPEEGEASVTFDLNLWIKALTSPVVALEVSTATLVKIFERIVEATRHEITGVGEGPVFSSLALHHGAELAFLRPFWLHLRRRFGLLERQHMVEAESMQLQTVINEHEAKLITIASDASDAEAQRDSAVAMLETCKREVQTLRHNEANLSAELQETIQYVSDERNLLASCKELLAECEGDTAAKLSSKNVHDTAVEELSQRSAEAQNSIRAHKAEIDRLARLVSIESQELIDIDAQLESAKRDATQRDLLVTESFRRAEEMSLGVDTQSKKLMDTVSQEANLTKQLQSVVESIGQAEVTLGLAGENVRTAEAQCAVCEVERAELVSLQALLSESSAELSDAAAKERAELHAEADYLEQDLLLKMQKHALSDRVATLRSTTQHHIAQQRASSMRRSLSGATTTGSAARHFNISRSRSDSTQAPGLREVTPTPGGRFAGNTVWNEL